MLGVNCDVNRMTYDYIIFGFVLLARFCYCLKSIIRIIIWMGIGMKMGNNWHCPCCARVAAASQRITASIASESKEWHRAMRALFWFIQFGADNWSYHFIVDRIITPNNCYYFRGTRAMQATIERISHWNDLIRLIANWLLRATCDQLNEGYFFFCCCL